MNDLGVAQAIEDSPMVQCALMHVVVDALQKSKIQIEDGRIEIILPNEYKDDIVRTEI